MLRILAPAKINLFLDILDKREDGYHNLVTIFQAIDWHDELFAEPSLTEVDQLVVEGAFAEEIPADEGNLVLKAIALLRQHDPTVPFLQVRLQKNIPSQAGLGGGSSDAAAGLLAALHYSGLDFSLDYLESLSGELGCDCPFFVRGGTQQGTGRGEELRPLVRTRKFWVLVAVPKGVVSTREAFSALAPREKAARTDSLAVCDWLAGISDELPPLANSFQRHAVQSAPDIAEVLDHLSWLGAEQTLLSGSGSSCYGIFVSRENAMQAAANWALPVRAVRAVRPLDEGIGFHHDVV